MENDKRKYIFQTEEAYLKYRHDLLNPIDRKIHKQFRVMGQSDGFNMWMGVGGVLAMLGFITILTTTGLSGYEDFILFRIAIGGVIAMGIGGLIMMISMIVEGNR